MNANIVKTINYIKRNGLIKTFYAASERVKLSKQSSYTYTPLGKEERLDQLAGCIDFHTSFSVLVPAYNTPERFLKAMIESVQNQTYSKWELVIADASEDDTVSRTVNSFVDKRIQYIKLAQNEGISVNSNKALENCKGDYVCLLDHDDILTEDALFLFAKAVEMNDRGVSPLLLYSDEDKTNSDNTDFFEANIKPEFDLDLLMSNNYICHFLGIKRELIQKMGFRKEYDGAQDHDLILRCVKELMDSYGKGYDKYICHISKVLYHWRCHNESTALNPKSKAYAYSAGARAVQDFVNSVGYKATVSETEHVGFFYVNYEPDVFEQRSDVAAVGTRMVHKGCVVDGVRDENNKILFEGLNAHYSGGFTHPAACQRQVEWVNINGMIPSERAVLVLEDLISKNNPQSKKEWDEVNDRFCAQMKAEGYIFLYDPGLLTKV